MNAFSASAVLSLALAGCAGAPAPSVAVPADLPAAIRAPAGELPFLQVHATGVQIYECAAKPDAPAAYAWQFRGPEATLADASGKTVGRHFAGPSWALDDGSAIVGQASASAPATQPGAIPWLLLSVKSHSGQGALAQATSVQRLETVGGVAPSAPCGEANAHQTERVGYTASYVFYKRAT